MLIRLQLPINMLVRIGFISKKINEIRLRFTRKCRNQCSWVFSCINELYWHHLITQDDWHSTSNKVSKGKNCSGRWLGVLCGYVNMVNKYQRDWCSALLISVTSWMKTAHALIYIFQELDSHCRSHVPSGHYIHLDWCSMIFWRIWGRALVQLHL